MPVVCSGKPIPRYIQKIVKNIRKVRETLRFKEEVRHQNSMTQRQWREYLEDKADRIIMLARAKKEAVAKTTRVTVCLSWPKMYELKHAARRESISIHAMIRRILSDHFFLYDKRGRCRKLALDLLTQAARSRTRKP